MNKRIRKKMEKRMLLEVSSRRKMGLRRMCEYFQNESDKICAEVLNRAFETKAR